MMSGGGGDWLGSFQVYQHQLHVYHPVDQETGEKRRISTTQLCVCRHLGNKEMCPCTHIGNEDEIKGGINALHMLS